MNTSTIYEVFAYSGLFLINFQYTIGKFKNVLYKVPTRCNFLPERNTCRVHPSISSNGTVFTDKRGNRKNHY